MQVMIDEYWHFVLVRWKDVVQHARSRILFVLLRIDRSSFHRSLAGTLYV